MKLYNNSGFSVVIPWCNRDEIRTTLVRNAAWLQLHSVEILVVNCGGETHRLKELLQSSDIKGLRQIDIPRERFNKSLALNVGLYRSQAQHFFVLDTDIIVKSDLLTEASHIIDDQTFVTVGRVDESAPEPNLLPPKLTQALAGGFLAGALYTSAVDLSFSDGSSIQHRTSSRNLRDWSRAGAGLLIAKKKHLVEIGGYNSALEHWGWEDDDVQVRLRRQLGLRQIEIGEVLHLSHGDHARALFGESRDNADMMNFSLCCEQSCRGNFSGRYSRDIEVWKDRII